MGLSDCFLLVRPVRVKATTRERSDQERPEQHQHRLGLWIGYVMGIIKLFFCIDVKKPSNGLGPHWVFSGESCGVVLVGCLSLLEDDWE